MTKHRVRMLILSHAYQYAEQYTPEQLAAALLLLENAKWTEIATAIENCGGMNEFISALFAEVSQMLSDARTREILLFATFSLAA